MLIVFYAAMLVAGILLWVRWNSTPDDAIVWGTFVEDSCVPRVKGGCRSVGHWTSDDGTIQFREVDLDGPLGDDRTARAAYRPDESSSDPGIVHTQFGLSIAPWAFGGFMLCTSAMALYYGHKWWGWGRPLRAALSAVLPRHRRGG